MPALPPDHPGCPRRTARPQLPAAPGPSIVPRPLPDPAAVQLCLIPDSAPPYDTEVTAAAGQGPAGPGRAPGTGSLPGRPETGQPRGPSAPPGARGAPGARRSPGWPGQFAQVLAETLAGSRSPRQLMPWTTERALDRIQRLGPQLSCGQQPRIRRVVTCHPTADTMEMTVVVGFGQRIHALAVRLERAGSRPAAAGRAAPPGRWLCTAVEAA